MARRSLCSAIFVFWILQGALQDAIELLGMFNKKPRRTCRLRDHVNLAVTTVTYCTYALQAEQSGQLPSPGMRCC